MPAFHSLIPVYVLALAAVASGIAAQTESENFAVTESMELLWSVHADQRNIILNSFKDCQADGFAYYESEYRWPAMRRVAPEGTLTVRVPEAGRFHLGAVVYDDKGRERFEMEVDGKRVGGFIADADNRRQRLFFTPDPLELSGGETIVLRAAGDSGLCVVEDIVLLSTRPPVLAPRIEIRNLKIGYDQTTERMRTTWLTTLPTKCTLHHDEGEVVERMAVQNHRIYLPQFQDKRQFTCWVNAGEVKSETIEIVSGPCKTPQGSAQRRQLKLRVLRGGDANSAGYPLTAGIPFPPGALGDSRNIRLLLPNGDEWLSQARTLARWPDESVKVSLVDTFAPTEDEITLEYGSQVEGQQPEGGIRVVQDANRVAVTTCWLRMEFDRRVSGLFTSLALRSYPLDDSQPYIPLTDRPPRFCIVDDAGQLYDTLGPTEALVVEEAGPLKAVVRLDGHHRNDAGRFFTYQVRFTFHHLLRGVRLSYRWGNDESRSEFAKFRSLWLELPVDLDESARLSLGTDRVLDSGHIEQWDYDPNRIDQRVNPWAAASDGRRQAAMLCRHFRQLYPKAMSVTQGLLRLDLCPELDGTRYRDGTEMDLVKLYYYLQDGRYKVRQGMTRTHEMLLLWALGGDAPEAETLCTLSETLDNPPVLAAPPEWYAQSGAFGDFVPKTAQRTPVYDDTCERAYNHYVELRDEGRMYGMLNFGDLFGERRANWSNGEYDHHHTAAQMFVRAADVRWHHLMEVMARHSIDVDICHYHANPYYRGSSWLHAMGHTGGYFEKPYQGQWGIPDGGTTVDHVWTEGMCEYYLLTGDPSAIEVARNIADRYAGVYLNHYDFANGRIPGWHLIHLMAVYRVTYDPYYLNAARLIVDRVLERRTPGSGWVRQMVPGHCHCTPRCRGACSFMKGVLGIGLREYYRETGDQRIPPAIVDAARYVIEQMWVPEHNAFSYTSCPQSEATASRVDALAGLLLFAHELSGDPLFADVVTRGMNESLKETTDIADLRWMPYIMYALDRLSQTPIRDPLSQ
ncbi:MAG: hypothetical protein ABFD90_12415 [Phycisphaerales bacterium]